MRIDPDETQTSVPPTETECAGMSPSQMLNADGDMCIPIPDETPGMTAMVTPAPPDMDGGDSGGTVAVGAAASADDDYEDFRMLLVSEVEFVFACDATAAIRQMSAVGWISAKTRGRCIGRRDKRMRMVHLAIFAIQAAANTKRTFGKRRFRNRCKGKRRIMNLSLSADLSGGIWQFSPAHRFYSRLEDDKNKLGIR